MILRTDPKFHAHFIETFEYQIKEVERNAPPKSTSFDIKKLEEEIEQKSEIKVTRKVPLSNLKTQVRRYCKLGRTAGIKHEITCKKFEKSKNQRLLSKEILSLCLYAAGLSSYTKDFHSSNQWSNLINQEFQKEYHQEHLLGLKKTAHYKILNDETLFNANEANIMSLVVLPIYKRVFKLERHFCPETTTQRHERHRNVCTSDEGRADEKRSPRTPPRVPCWSATPSTRPTWTEACLRPRWSARGPRST